MSWSEEHEILFLREVLVNNPYQFKAGSIERGKKLDEIAEILITIPKPRFKVNQRSLRDKINKLMKEYVQKKNEEEKASGIEVEHTEKDVLWEELYQLKCEHEKMEKLASENKSKSIENEMKAADSMRRKSFETWSQTKKRENMELDDEETPIKKRNNGNDTVNYLREKSENEMEIRKRELELMKEELALQKERDENANRRLEQILENSQQQNQAIMVFMAKMMNSFVQKQ